MFNYNGNPYGGYNGGIPYNGYMNNNYTPTPNYQTPPQQTNTNKIFVNGLEDVKNRNLPQNSDFIFLDNDKPLVYRKTVDAQGQFKVETFKITPYSEQETQTAPQPIDLSPYVKKTDLKAFENELIAIKNKLALMNKGDK